MGPTKCSYFQCNNTTACKDLSMFRFPTLDDSRLKIWLENCGNKKMTRLSKKELRRRYVCIEHFDTKYILESINRIRTRLSRYAVPEHYGGEDLPSPEAPDDHTFDDPPFLEINKPIKTYSKLGPLTSTVSAGESSQNTMHNEVKSTPVNIYGYRMKKQRYRYKQTSRRNRDEEKNIDMEPNIKGKEVVNKMEKMSQMTESSYLDAKDIKHDVAKVLEVSVDPSEMDGRVESCTVIKQEPLEIEIEFEVQEPDTQKQATELTEVKIEDKSNTCKVPKVAVKVENAEPEETEKHTNEAETETKAQQIEIELYPQVQITKPKTSPEKTLTRILNTEIDNTVVSKSILEPVAMKLEIKPEPGDDSIILRTSDSSVERSHLSSEPGVILNTGRGKRKMYRCSRCDYAGFHEEYREHVNHNCVGPVRGKIVKNDVKDNYDEQKADSIRKQTTERVPKKKVVRKIKRKPTQVPKVAVKVENAEPEETQRDENKLDIISQTILKKEKVSDDEDAKPDVAVLGKSLIEMNDDVQMCTAIKQETKDYRE